MDQSTLMMAGLVVFVLVAFWILLSGDGKEKTRARMDSVTGVEGRSPSFAFMKAKDDTGYAPKAGPGIAGKARSRAEKTRPSSARRSSPA